MSAESRKARLKTAEPRKPRRDNAASKKVEPRKPRQRKAEPRKVERKPRVPRGEAAKERGKFTAEKRRLFLEYYQTGMTVRQAAQKIGVSNVAVFNHVRKNEEFRREYEAAMEANTDVLEDGLHHLARAGNIAAIFGTLKARRPERWRDRVDLSNKDGSLLKPLADAIRRAHGIGGGTGE